MLYERRHNGKCDIKSLEPVSTASRPLATTDVRFEAFRAGGPGGQHQNKTESAVRAVHLLTGLAVVARDQRSQHRNKAAALARLAELLRLNAELAALTARQDAQANHDRLERGGPVRRFMGPSFTPC